MGLGRIGRQVCLKILKKKVLKEDTLPTDYMGKGRIRFGSGDVKREGVHQHVEKQTVSHVL